MKEFENTYMVHVKVTSVYILEIDGSSVLDAEERVEEALRLGEVDWRTEEPSVILEEEVIEVGKKFPKE